MMSSHQKMRFNVAYAQASDAAKIAVMSGCDAVDAIYAARARLDHALAESQGRRSAPTKKAGRALGAACDRGEEAICEIEGAMDALEVVFQSAVEGGVQFCDLAPEYAEMRCIAMAAGVIICAITEAA